MGNDRNEFSSPQARQVARRFMLGSSWMLATRWGVRGIGILSTIVLARLLSPADFGIVAMAMLVIGFAEMFGETGQQLALIQHPDPKPEHYHSAWSTSVVFNSAITLAVICSAPLAVFYFKDPRIVPVIQVLSLRILLAGLVNIGVVDFRRRLDFAKEFRLGIYRKILTFGATLVMAATLRTYWALVFGTVLGSALEVLLSYGMSSFRPRLEFSRALELWKYSGWLMAQAFGTYFEGRIDEVVVAGFVDPGNVGRYTVASELGALPMTEVLDPIERALFPNYSRLEGGIAAMRGTYLQVLSIATMICAAMGIGIALVAQDLVAVFLGPQWTAAAPLVAYLAIAAAFTGVSNSVFGVLNALGVTRYSALQTWLRVAAYLPAMVWAAHTGEVSNFAMAKPVVAAALAPTFFVALRRILPISWREIAAATWRSPCAALVMCFGVVSLQTIMADASPYLRLPAAVLLGALLFTAAQYGFWLLAGRPFGVERVVIGRLLEIFNPIQASEASRTHVPD